MSSNLQQIIEKVMDSDPWQVRIDPDIGTCVFMCHKGLKGHHVKDNSFLTPTDPFTSYNIQLCVIWPLKMKDILWVTFDPYLLGQN